MSAFIAKIQLHKAAAADYEILNKSINKDASILKKKKLSVKSDKAKKGEYNYRGNISLTDVVNAVYRAIKKTGLDYSFTVINNKAVS